MFSDIYKKEPGDYWDSRYFQGNLDWDAGGITTPLKEYIDQIGNKNIKILIPGAGNAYEAEYLHRSGFRDVYVLDISKEAVKGFKRRFPDFGNEFIVTGDFFKHEGGYDLILEQTFLCSLLPQDRQKYFNKIYSLLNKRGKLAGVLFNRVFEKEGPPFGGFKEEYIEYFKKLFDIKVYEEAYNSIKPRAGKELFINLIKKD